HDQGRDPHLLRGPGQSRRDVPEPQRRHQRGPARVPEVVSGRRTCLRTRFMSRLISAMVVILLPALARAADAGAIASASKDAGGVRLHYLSAGKGPAIILLHGYAETSRMWRPLIPRLAERYSVVAPDLPGIGDSDIPKDAVDMKWAAARVHDLVRSLGIQKAEVVGHDIGLMVAYAYAAQYPTEVTRLVLMDAFLPG